MSKYIVCAQGEYIDGRFEGGLVLESEHDQNEIYLRFSHDSDENKEWIHELTPREAAILIMCLSAAMVGRESALEDILYGGAGKDVALEEWKARGCI